MSNVERILEDLLVLRPLMEALHARTCLREVWDAIHTMNAGYNDERLEAWLEAVTRGGSVINQEIEAEVSALALAAMTMDLTPRDHKPISHEERQREKSRRKREAKYWEDAMNRAAENLPPDLDDDKREAHPTD